VAVDASEGHSEHREIEAAVLLGGQAAHLVAAVVRSQLEHVHVVAGL
jgi:hypothetical protein